MDSNLTPKQILDRVLDESSFGDSDAFVRKFSAYLVKDFSGKAFFEGPITQRLGSSHIIIQGNTLCILLSNMKQTMDYHVKSQIIVAY